MRLCKLHSTCFFIFVLASLPSKGMPQAGSAVPQGTYLKTCGAFRFDGTTLNATCRLETGQSQIISALNVKACSGDVWNDNGVLRCYARPGTWGEGRAIPRGSYLQSCSGASVTSVVLKAICVTRDNTDLKRAKNSSLDLRQCRMGSNISNIDGQLVCIN